MSDAKRESKHTADDKASKSSQTDTPSPAGPHDTPELTDKSKTPGSGMLPEKDDPNEAPTG